MRTNGRHITELYGIYAAMILRQEKTPLDNYIDRRNELIAEFISVTSYMTEQVDSMLNG